MNTTHAIAEMNAIAAIVEVVATGDTFTSEDHAIVFALGRRYHAIGDQLAAVGVHVRPAS